MQWRWWLLPATILLIVFLPGSRSLGQSSGAVADIVLNVTEWSNINRTNDPLTSGVPIPADAPGYNWALFDGVSEIPVQTTILPGLKTPWVLLDFQPTISSGATKTYTLKQQTPTASPSQPLLINEDNSQITVTTGTFRTQLSKTDFNFLDTVWLDSNSDGTFASGERLITPAAGSNLTINDVASGNQFSGRGAPTTIIWEYQGPLRATLRVDGPYKNGATTLLDYTTRITWYAGQSYVRVEHLIRNSLATQERYVKVSSAKLNAGTSTTTHRIAKSGDSIWSNVVSGGGTSVELIPATVVISSDYDPISTPPVERVQQTLNVDVNGGMIMADLSYHGATVQLDFAAGLSAGEKTRRTTAAKDPLIALAPEAQYSDLGAFGNDHFGTYQDEKDTYTKWGWTWPTGGNVWSQEHNRPRVQTMYVSWSDLSANDPEADELWQNIMMLTRVRIPYYLDRLRSWARFWNWEWSMRSDGYQFNGTSSNWYYGNGIARTPVIQPTLTAADSDFIDHNIKLAKADVTHNWNGGSIDYYYLTGDKDSLQAAIDMAEQCKMSFIGRTPQNLGVGGTGSRYTLRCLMILTRTWEATNDAQWKTAADSILPLFLQSPTYDSRGFYYSGVCNIGDQALCDQYPGGKFLSGFMAGVGVDSLYRYYLATDNLAVKMQLSKIAEFARDNALDPVTGYGGDEYIIDSPAYGNVVRIPVNSALSSMNLTNAMVIGYRLSGDTTYLHKAQLAWDRGSKGPVGSRNATATQVGRFANSMQGAAANEYMYRDGGDLTYMSLLFYDAAREDDTAPAAVSDLSAL